MKKVVALVLAGGLAASVSAQSPDGTTLGNDWVIFNVKEKASEVSVNSKGAGVVASANNKTFLVINTDSVDDANPMEASWGGTPVVATFTATPPESTKGAFSLEVQVPGTGLEYVALGKYRTSSDGTAKNLSSKGAGVDLVASNAVYSTLNVRLNKKATKKAAGMTAAELETALDLEAGSLAKVGTASPAK